jgi:hypothetical protein
VEVSAEFAEEAERDQEEGWKEKDLGAIEGRGVVLRRKKENGTTSKEQRVSPKELAERVAAIHCFGSLHFYSIFRYIFSTL